MEKFGLLPVGDQIESPYVIAEIGLCHNGSIEIARELIYESFKAGASLIKLQKRAPLKLATKEYLERNFAKFPTVGTTQISAREKVEMGKEEYKMLFKYAESLGMIPFATVFDEESLEFMKNLNAEYIKIASHSSSNKKLIDAVCKTGIPFFISLGGLKENEQEILLNKELKGKNCAIFHCVSAYPTMPNEFKLDTITKYKESGYITGLSTHERGYKGTLIGAYLGAEFIERHITLSNASIGFDHSISLEPNEFKEMVKNIKGVSSMRGVKNKLEDSELGARTNYHSGLFLNKNKKTNEPITIEDIDIRQPLGKSIEAITCLEFQQKTNWKASVDIQMGNQILTTNIK